MLQAILLDRDGVINRERSDYVKSPEELELLPGVLHALSRLALLNIPILIITNQSAVGRGLMTQEAVNSIHRHLQRIVRAANGRIDAFYVCPHHPQDGCPCRKPKPGLLLEAASDFRLDLDACIFVGDSITDYQAACAAGCPVILVASGQQGMQLPFLLPAHSPTPIMPDLPAAVSLILNSQTRSAQIALV